MCKRDVKHIHDMKVSKCVSMYVSERTLDNLINIQRLGLGFKKASTVMHKVLRLTVIFESYKHELEAY